MQLFFYLYIYLKLNPWTTICGCKGCAHFSGHKWTLFHHIIYVRLVYMPPSESSRKILNNLSLSLILQKRWALLWHPSILCCSLTCFSSMRRRKKLNESILAWNVANVLSRNRIWQLLKWVIAHSCPLLTVPFLFPFVSQCGAWQPGSWGRQNKAFTGWGMRDLLLTLFHLYR